MADELIASRRWGDVSWRAETEAWVAARLRDAGLALTGPAEQVRRRPWATVLRCPTAHGPVWFKAMARGVAFEAPLLVALAEWFPDRVLRPVAAEVTRGWLLLPDGGLTLRQAQHGHTDAAHWAEILADHAEFQRLCAGRAGDLIALGVPDRRPERLPLLRDELLSDESRLLVGGEHGMTRAQVAALRADTKRYAGWCDELAGLGVPPSLQHDDLHDDNVFVPPDPGGHYRVFDWGDSSVAHPFAVLLVALRVVAHLHKLDYGAPQLLRLRDAYLEPWEADFDRPTLREAARLAVRVGGVSRASSYVAALVEGTPEDRREHDEDVPYWLMETYRPTPLDPISLLP